MHRILSAAILALAVLALEAAPVWASCSTQTICTPYGCTICTTCCTSTGFCNTFCS